ADTHEHSRASIPVRANTAPLNGKGNNSSLPNPSTALPVISAEWPKNARGVVRDELHEFNERHVVGARVWYLDGDEVKPSKAGHALVVRPLPALADAMAKALETARGGER